MRVLPTCLASLFAETYIHLGLCRYARFATVKVAVPQHNWVCKMKVLVLQHNSNQVNITSVIGELSL